MQATKTMRFEFHEDANNPEACGIVGTEDLAVIEAWSQAARPSSNLTAEQVHNLWNKLWYTITNY